MDSISANYSGDEALVRRNEMGQDIIAGTRLQSPSADLNATENRSTEQLKLRLQPLDAARLRHAAKIAGRNLSEHVMALLNNGARVEVTSDDRATLAEMARTIDGLYVLCRELERSRLELGRQGGLAKHKFDVAAHAAESQRVKLSAIVSAWQDSAATAADAIVQARAVLTPLESLAARLR